MWKSRWLTASLADVAAAPATRVAWADIAKAISIILLVFWATAGDSLYLNEMLILVRMPLFFLVAGLFAARAVTGTSTESFLRDKIGNLLYLYALWIGILFLSRDVVAHLMFGRAIDPLRQLQLFWDPIFTIWFLYALAVAFFVARLVRRLPVVVVFAAALLLYTLSVATGEWRHLPFLERVVRLFPFFWLGLVLQPFLQRVVERHYRLWPVAAAAFLGLAYLVFDSPLNAIGPLTFGISLIGVLAMLLLARHLADTPWSAPLTIVGSATLYIYVLHKPILFYLEHGLRFLGIDFPGIEAALVVPVVLLGTVFGRWAMGVAWARWLFRAPWVGARMRTSAPA